ncbi:Putative KHG/KDPG aldolase [Planktothrix tepida]|uniref:2-dehydro-3-deoxyphosphogluconate aldolase/4-hydroxy-2-oxoglutarate aldolase n=2 Tax=Planktothrix TaxID=54304 RepID=A0A1J1LI72_9CYAN|nr:MULTISPECIES: bifunctional 4-hydroxy-2-oxoglutarate aldolase/2-dehydro-3-deoxy-phosphogluconate aldolase [Planktothrix]CAD5931194.1 Putative KHG/KDPG aldolase [Planktothrix tepida]CAD5979035.1 Putative KHG/KDPG aldolase [Planktothrix pseudagardhii]CUR31588.1 2-dehydro-3-deoxyphosphogluconate aldolase/4-hydroxy-2-oxoglutarate aldolase [Planktothrix tepida PCC 9214]
MTSKIWLSLLKQYRAIAVIRAPKRQLGKQMAQATAAGGMGLIEITWNSDQAPELIAELRSELPDCVIGTGTLFTVEDVKNAIASGAQFLFSPHTNPAMIQAAKQAEIPIIPGALSPTEIITAWQAGASCVKVFPISAVGGVDYLKSIKGPMGNIPLIPTGGVTLNNAVAFIQAGAIAVGLAGDLFPPAVMVEQNWDAIAQKTQILLQQLSEISN